LKIDIEIKRIFVIVICAVSLYSCKSREGKVEDVVNKFLTEINDRTKTLSQDLMTEEFAIFFKGKSYYSSQDWVLTAKPENDSTITVESKGKTHNGWGQPVEILQSFILRNRNGHWKIFSSYNLVPDRLDFRVVDTEWDFYWDRAKDRILKELQEKLTIEVLVPGYRGYYSTRGKLRISNNSDYDVEGIRILIEHFDSQGKSVNTDYTYVWDIVRKNGYREFEWSTGDCDKCERQEFKINFIREH